MKISRNLTFRWYIWVWVSLFISVCRRKVQSWAILRFWSHFQQFHRRTANKLIVFWYEAYSVNFYLVLLFTLFVMTHVYYDWWLLWKHQSALWRFWSKILCIFNSIFGCIPDIRILLRPRVAVLRQHAVVCVCACSVVVFSYSDPYWLFCHILCVPTACFCTTDSGD